MNDISLVRIEPPAVTADEARGDREWFFAHPGRRYRARRGAAGWWLIRRRTGGVLLRTWTAEIPPGLPDSDESLRPAWFNTAWASLSQDDRDELIRASRKSERSGAPRSAKPARRRRAPPRRHTKPLRGRAEPAPAAGPEDDALLCIPHVHPTTGEKS